MVLIASLMTMRTRYHIGTLERKEGGVSKEDDNDEIEPVFLSKTKWKKAKLVTIKTLSHDSRLYRFALQSETQLLGLVSIACHVKTRVDC